MLLGITLRYLGVDFWLIIDDFGLLESILGIWESFYTSGSQFWYLKDNFSPDFRPLRVVLGLLDSMLSHRKSNYGLC